MAEGNGSRTTALIVAGAVAIGSVIFGVDRIRAEQMSAVQRQMDLISAQAQADRTRLEAELIRVRIWKDKTEEGFPSSFKALEERVASIQSRVDKLERRVWDLPEQ